MSQRRSVRGILGVIIASLSLTASAMAVEPRIDVNSQWTVQKQVFTPDGGVSLAGLGKMLRVGTGALQNTACFGEITVPGIVIDGQVRTFARAIGQDRAETSEATEYRGIYEVLYGDPEQAVPVRLAFELYRDGKFKITAGSDSGSPHVVAVPVYLNYDFQGPNHDVFEFAWNITSSHVSGAGDVVDPPLGQSPLAYGTSASAVRETVDYFATVPHEIEMSYNGVYQSSNRDSIEYTALARIYDAYSKLGAVIWPWSDGETSTTDYTVVFQRRAAGAAIVPSADTTKTLQTTGSHVASLPRYVFDGSDEAVTIILRGTVGAGNRVQVAGKLFQKSSKRDLRLRVHYWPAMFPWVPEGSPAPAAFVFDPDYEATAYDGSRMSLRKAYQGLVGDAASVRIDVTAESAGTPADFTQALKLTRDFSAAAQEEVEAWQSDLFIFPGSTNQQGIMPDFMGGGNKVEREGAQVSWDAIRETARQNFANGLPENRWKIAWQLDRATIAAIHELGHTMNLQHEWGQNGIMTSGSDHIGTPVSLSFGDQCVHWFRAMPETWVKPGRYGVMFGGYLTGSSAPIDPQYTPNTEAPVLGDVDFNGVVDIVDALKVTQAYVGLDESGDYYPGVGDVNCSGTVDIVDALLIAQEYVDLIPGFSCPSG